MSNLGGPDDTEEQGSAPIRLVGDQELSTAPSSRPRHDDAQDDAHEHAPPPTTHPHEHAHEHEGATQTGAFPHERLDAYRVALRMASQAKDVARAIPRGQRNVADHLQRASQNMISRAASRGKSRQRRGCPRRIPTCRRTGANTVLLLAEGANRRKAGEKRQRFGESRGECGEVAAAADLVIVMALGPPADAQELKALAGRVSAMLTGPIDRLR